MFKNLKNLFDRVFWVTFVVLFLLHSFAVTIVYSLGFTSGFEGETAWSWEQYGATLNSLFGDFGSVSALLVALAIFVSAVWLAGWFARHQHTVWSRIWFLFGTLVGGFILYRVVDWSSFGFGIGPVIALIIFSMICALISKLVAKAMTRKPKLASVPASSSAAAS